MHPRRTDAEEPTHDQRLREKEDIDKRLAIVARALEDDSLTSILEDPESPSFRAISDVMGRDSLEDYARSCPDLFEQHRKIYGILDDFDWGQDHHESSKELAAFFKDHPEQFKEALAFGTRLSKLSTLEADDPAIESLARESAAFIREHPRLKDPLGQRPEMKAALAEMYGSMIENTVPPAQVQFGTLLQRFLSDE